MIPVLTDLPENTNLSTKANTSAIVPGSVVNFTCTSKASPAPHEYKFYRKGIFLQNSANGVFEAKVTESGLYSCTPVNKAGEGANGTVYITVVGESNWC